MKKIGALILIIILAVLCCSCRGNDIDPLFKGNWGASVSLSDRSTELSDKINSLIEAEDGMRTFRLFGWDSYVLSVALKIEESDGLLTEQTHIEKLKLNCRMSDGAFAAAGDIKMSVSVLCDGKPVPLYTEGKTYVKDGHHYVSTRIDNSGETIKKMFSCSSFSDIIIFEISEKMPPLYSVIYGLLGGDISGVKAYIDDSGAKTKLKLEYDVNYLADNSDVILGETVTADDIKFRSFYTVLVWDESGEFIGLRIVLDADVNSLINFWDISVKSVSVNIEFPDDLGTYSK